MPIDAPSLHRFLYVSRLAPHSPSSVVGQILRQSRERNRIDGLTGALLFDGDRFCQLLEGPPDVINGAKQRIARDGRHVDLRTLLDEAAAARVMQNWQCGYCDHGSFEPLEAIAVLNRQLVLDAFRQLLRRCELST